MALIEGDRGHRRSTRIARQKRSKVSFEIFDDVDAFYKDKSTVLMHGDALDQVASLPSNSVNTCLTSPPYWKARDYGTELQLGQEVQLEDYIDRICGIFKEIRRVLTSDGSVWLNIGDTYLHGVGTVKGRPPEAGWKRNKQLSLAPWKVAIALQEQGWWVRNAAVWHKPNAMPESVEDRLANSWEPMFLLTKSERYWFDLDAIREPHSTNDAVERTRAERGRATGKAAGQTSLRKYLKSPRHRATIEGLKEVRLRPNAPESVELAAYLRQALLHVNLSIKEVAVQLGEPFERTRHYFRTDEIGSRLPPEETWAKLKEILRLDSRYDAAMTVVSTDNAFRNHKSGRNPGDVLSIATARSTAGHFAVMPLQLAEKCLKASLPPDGVCLDPFMGTGTTGIAAMKLGGRFVGIDNNLTYLKNFTIPKVDIIDR